MLPSVELKGVVCCTVCLPSIYYQVLGYPEFPIAPMETIIGLVKKI